MLNFAVGPVQSSDAVREIGQEQVPYFRTPEFSELMFENERLVKDFAGAEENARVVFLTGSGTAAMEAAADCDPASLFQKTKCSSSTDSCCSTKYNRYLAFES